VKARLRRNQPVDYLLLDSCYKYSLAFVRIVP
jgi:hypothetical protein